MTNPYTPEKVAELVADARSFDAVIVRGAPTTSAELIDRLADALTAASAERGDARSDLNAETAAHADSLNLLSEVIAERDRLHKAITEALAFESVLPAIATEPRRILRAALDKEGERR